MWSRYNSNTYELLEKEIVNRQSGRNKIPVCAVIPSLQDALRLLRKQREAERFIALTRLISSEWPTLSDWIFRYPHRILELENEWPRLLAVLKWFFVHPRCGLYLRQLDIPSIDTKYIENRKGLLTELLDKILPEEATDTSSSAFEKRYGLLAKQPMVRYRLLDPSQSFSHVVDASVPLDQFTAWAPPVSRVFFTENEINAICFPNIKNACIISMLGYRVDSLKCVTWLRDKEIYYWGDIDTHGFAILDLLRGFLPQTQSFLMDEDTLLAHRELWSFEEKPFIGQPTHLNDDERTLFFHLQSNVWQQGVRMEQERISFSFVQRALKPFF